MPGLAESSILVHIGLPKTATTWLQLHLLSSAERGFFPAWDENGTPRKRLKAIAYMLYRGSSNRLLHDDDFDADAIVRRIERINVPQGLCPVISSERLGGAVLSNGFDRASICGRIGRIFPNARILLVIREQHSMIVSSYMAYLRKGGWHSIENFVEPRSDCRLPTPTRAHWCYDRLISLYQGAFGPDRLLVLPYEMLTHSPVEFTSSICRFADVSPPDALPWNRKENAHREFTSTYYLRRLTRIHRRSSANAYYPSVLKGKVGATIDQSLKAIVQALVPSTVETRLKARLERRLRRFIGDGFYRESNRRTRQLTGVELDRYGYEI